MFENRRFSEQQLIRRDKYHLTKRRLPPLHQPGVNLATVSSNQIAMEDPFNMMSIIKAEDAQQITSFDADHSKKPSTAHMRYRENKNMNQFIEQDHLDISQNILISKHSRVNSDGNPQDSSYDGNRVNQSV